MSWEVVIGIETHVQLKTKNKIFSRAAVKNTSEPNTEVDFVDIGLPGTLPIFNPEVIECAIKLGLAINAKINTNSYFERKNYFYPDLPKGYQISQFAVPIVEKGELFLYKNFEKTIQITRAHLEEDAGKLIHDSLSQASAVDYNRAGTPLLEIVTEPEIFSADEAVEYAKTLHELVVWLGISNGNLQEGNFRCDANVSVKKIGSNTLGTRREIKNLNSFRFLREAIEYEKKWQISQLESGNKIIQATVLYDSQKKITKEMRSKEDSHDYRYFPDPDLVPILIEESTIDSLRNINSLIPHNKYNNYLNKCKLKKEEALGLIESIGKAKLFDDSISQYVEKINNDENFYKNLFNLINSDLAKLINKNAISHEECPISSSDIFTICYKLTLNEINSNIAKILINELWSGDKDLKELLKDKTQRLIKDDSAIIELLNEIIKTHPQECSQYKNGKDKALNFLVGKVMQKSKGSINPADAQKRLKELIKE
jgi:aspartyl-tRNA(Asn)/glutamyl-tRNA(Gln) amidotransferase subunit B